jgi:hypothetical protein
LPGASKGSGVFEQRADMEIDAARTLAERVNSQPEI